MATIAKSILIGEHPKKKESKGQRLFLIKLFFFYHERKAFPETFCRNSLTGLREQSYPISKGIEITMMGLES